VTHPVPYDPVVQIALEQYLADRPPLTAETIGEARRFNLANQPAVDLRGGAVEASEHVAPGPPGAPDVFLTVYRPTGHREPGPGLYYVHGGGMVLGNRRSGINPLLDWVIALGAVVVSVEYRLAPECPYPGPVEDCYAGLAWTAEHAADLGVDADRLAIVGVSAGGGLAAATVIVARDRGGPRLKAQMLICPMLDDRNNSVSSRQYDTSGNWNGRNNEVGWTALLGDRRGATDVPPTAAPARLGDFRDLPPAFIDAGSAEVFRDEVVQYASSLWAAGVQAELHIWGGGCHGFFNVAPDAPLSVQAFAVQKGWLERVFAE
jgi:acetyl esterase/lipase